MTSGKPPPAGTPTRVVVADDHSIFRAGLVQLLSGKPGFEVVGETADGQEAIDLCRRFRPELLLTDVVMPGMGGIEVTHAIKQEFPHIIVMILTALKDPKYLSEAVRAGAAGYILKYATAQQITVAIREVLVGEYWLDPEVTKKWVLRHILSEPLTKREREVLRLIARGLTNQQIADNLFVTPSNVKKHVGAVLTKLRVSDRTQAAIKANKLGLLPEEEKYR